MLLASPRFAFFRFLLIGVVSNIINFLVYLTTYTLFSNIAVAVFLGYLSGLLNSLYFSKSFVFSHLEPREFGAFWRFAFIYCVGWAGMTAITAYLHGDWGVDYRVSWLGGAAFALVNNYFGSKWAVTRSRAG